MSSFGGISGPMYGAPFIGYDTGVRHPPHYIANCGTTLATTINRAYYMPFFVAEVVTFSSIITWNSGAGDNGDTYRLAIYANDGTAGPGTLIQDIGQITLTAAAAARTLSATINLQSYAGQWVWVMLHANQSASMEDMNVTLGTQNEPQLSVGFGTFDDLTTSANNMTTPFRYVDTAYGAAAATAVAPTGSLTTAPVFALVK